MIFRRRMWRSRFEIKDHIDEPVLRRMDLEWIGYWGEHGSFLFSSDLISRRWSF